MCVVQSAPCDLPKDKIHVHSLSCQQVSHRQRPWSFLSAADLVTSRSWVLTNMAHTQQSAYLRQTWVGSSHRTLSTVCIDSSSSHHLLDTRRPHHHCKHFWRCWAVCQRHAAARAPIKRQAHMPCHAAAQSSVYGEYDPLQGDSLCRLCHKGACCAASISNTCCFNWP